MTTGRINQVTAFPKHTARVPKLPLQQLGSSHLRDGMFKAILAKRIPDATPSGVMRAKSSNCLEALLSFLPPLNQRFESCSD
jgi:hypothetical protein